MAPIMDICRICLQEMDYEDIQEIDLTKLGRLIQASHLPKWDVQLFRDHFLCSTCINNFRSLSILHKYLIKSNSAVVCLRKKVRNSFKPNAIDLKKLDQFRNRVDEFLVCRVCVEPTKFAAIYLYDNPSNIMPLECVRLMLKYIKLHMTLLDKTKNPIICFKCWQRVQVTYSFRKHIDVVGGKLEHYQKLLEKTYMDREDLQDILHMWDKLGPSETADMSPDSDTTVHIISASPIQERKKRSKKEMPQLSLEYTFFDDHNYFKSQSKSSKHDTTDTDSTLTINTDDMPLLMRLDREQTKPSDKSLQSTTRALKMDKQKLSLNPLTVDDMPLLKRLHRERNEQKNITVSDKPLQSTTQELKSDKQNLSLNPLNKRKRKKFAAIANTIKRVSARQKLKLISDIKLLVNGQTPIETKPELVSALKSKMQKEKYQNNTVLDTNVGVTADKSKRITHTNVGVKAEKAKCITHTNVGVTAEKAKRITRLSAKKDASDEFGFKDLLVLQKEEILKKKRVKKTKPLKIKHTSTPKTKEPVQLVNIPASQEKESPPKHSVNNEYTFERLNFDNELQVDSIEDEEIQIKREVISDSDDGFIEECFTQDTTGCVTDDFDDSREDQCPDLDAFIKTEPEDIMDVEEDEDEPPQLELQGPCNYDPKFTISDTFSVNDKRHLINTVDEKRDFINGFEENSLKSPVLESRNNKSFGEAVKRKSANISYQESSMKVSSEKPPFLRVKKDLMTEPKQLIKDLVIKLTNFDKSALGSNASEAKIDVNPTSGRIETRSQPTRTTPAKDGRMPILFQQLTTETLGLNGREPKIDFTPTSGRIETRSQPTRTTPAKDQQMPILVQQMTDTSIKPKINIGKINQLETPPPLVSVRSSIGPKPITMTNPGRSVEKNNQSDQIVPPPTRSIRVMLPFQKPSLIGSPPEPMAIARSGLKNSQSDIVYPTTKSVGVMYSHQTQSQIGSKSATTANTRRRDNRSNQSDTVTASRKTGGGLMSPFETQYSISPNAATTANHRRSDNKSNLLDTVTASRKTGGLMSPFETQYSISPNAATTANHRRSDNKSNLSDTVTASRKTGGLMSPFETQYSISPNAATISSRDAARRSDNKSNLSDTVTASRKTGSGLMSPFEPQYSISPNAATTPANNRKSVDQNSSSGLTSPTNRMNRIVRRFDPGFDINQMPIVMDFNSVAAPNNSSKSVNANEVVERPLDIMPPRVPVKITGTRYPPALINSAKVPPLKYRVPDPSSSTVTHPHEMLKKWSPKSTYSTESPLFHIDGKTKYFPRDLYGELESLEVNKQNPYRCRLCDFSASSKQGAISHITAHVANALYKCEICPLQTTRKDYLKVHYKNYHGVRIPESSTNRKLPKRIIFSRHFDAKLVDDQLTYFCKQCSYRATDAKLVKNHIKIHFDISKQYKCGICFKIGKHLIKCSACQYHFHMKCILTNKVELLKNVCCNHSDIKGGTTIYKDGHVDTVPVREKCVRHCNRCGKRVKNWIHCEQCSNYYHYRCFYIETGFECSHYVNDHQETPISTAKPNCDFCGSILKSVIPCPSCLKFMHTTCFLKDSHKMTFNCKHPDIVDEGVCVCCGSGLDETRITCQLCKHTLHRKCLFHDRDKLTLNCLHSHWTVDKPCSSSLDGISLSKECQTPLMPEPMPEPIASTSTAHRRTDCFDAEFKEDVHVDLTEFIMLCD